MRARVLSELRSWRLLDRRGMRAGAPSPLSPAQARALERQDKVRTVFFARGYIIYSLLGVLGAALMSATNAEAAFTGLNVAAAVALVGAYALTYRASIFAAGTVVMLVNVALPVVLSFVYSQDASFDLNLFGVGLAMFVLMFDAPAPIKLGFLLLISGTFVALQFLPERHGEELGMIPERLARVSLANNLLTVLTVLIAVLLLQVRFATTRRILEGTALYGEQQAITDELTGLVNRRPVHDLLDGLDRGRAHEYAIAVIDIDEFKTVNDAYGHECGDLAIAAVADALTDSFRDTDVVSRWGGDEFVIVIQKVLPAELQAMLERVRARVASTTYPCRGEARSVTISVGAAHGRPDRVAGDCFAAADQAVYRAKQEGRDRVVVVRDYPRVVPTSAPSPDEP